MHVMPADRWGELVEAATFDAMKARADLLAPDTTHGIRKDTTQFFTRGTRGQWHDQLPGADTDRYWNRVRALASHHLVTCTNGPERAPFIGRTRG
jgi:aryl sulfotransferase